MGGGAERREKERERKREKESNYRCIRKLYEAVQKFSSHQGSNPIQ